MPERGAIENTKQGGGGWGGLASHGVPMMFEEVHTLAGEELVMLRMWEARAKNQLGMQRMRKAKAKKHKPTRSRKAKKPRSQKAKKPRSPRSQEAKKPKSRKAKKPKAEKKGRKKTAPLFLGNLAGSELRTSSKTSPQRRLGFDEPSPR